MSLARSLSLTLIHRYPSQCQSLRQSRPRRRASWPPIGRGLGYQCSPLRNEVKLEELQQQAAEQQEEDEECDGFWGGAYEGGEALCRVETRDERFSRGSVGDEEEAEEEEDEDVDRAEYLGGFSLCRVQTRTSDVYDHPYYGYDNDSDEEDEDEDELEEGIEAEDESPELDDSHASDDSDEHDYDFDGDLDSQYEEDMRGWVGGEGGEDVSIHTGEEVEVEGVAMAVAVTQPRLDNGKGKARATDAEVAEMGTALEALLYRGGGELSRVKTRDEREGKSTSSSALMKRSLVERREAEVEVGRFEDADEGVVV